MERGTLDLKKLPNPQKERMAFLRGLIDYFGADVPVAHVMKTMAALDAANMAPVESKERGRVEGAA